jgi:hypothetical protein
MMAGILFTVQGINRASGRRQSVFKACPIPTENQEAYIGLQISNGIGI